MISNVFDDNYWTGGNCWHVVKIVITASDCMRCGRRPCNIGRLAVSIMPVSWEVACRWAAHAAHLATHYYLRRCERLLAYPCKLHACKQIIIIFYIFFFVIICYIYLVLFSIVLCRTIINVCPDNIFYIIIYGKCIINHWRIVFPVPEVKGCKKTVRLREQVATWFCCTVHTRWNLQIYNINLQIFYYWFHCILSTFLL